MRRPWWQRWPWLRRPGLAVAVLAMIAGAALSSCAPVAQAVADAIENSDGATLTYALDTDPRGVVFNPDGRLARGVIVRLEGDTLQILHVPEGATCRLEVTNTAAKGDCRLGDLTEASFIGVTGSNVAANATWRRGGSSTVYLTFARLPDAGHSQ